MEDDQRATKQKREVNPALDQKRNFSRIRNLLKEVPL